MFVGQWMPINMVVDVARKSIFIAGAKRDASTKRPVKRGSATYTGGRDTRMLQVHGDALKLQVCERGLPYIFTTIDVRSSLHTVVRSSR